MSGAKVIAVDIGRSTIRSAAFEHQDKALVMGEVDKTPRISTAGDVTGPLLDLLRQRLEVEKDVRAIGIGTTGQVSRQGYVSAALTDLYRQETPLGRWLTEELEVPVLVRNDVQLMALGEARHGAGRGWEVVFGVAIGSGVGGGVVRQGQLDIGSSGIAGECGHVRVVDSGERRACWCGGKGCLDVQVSGLALEERYYDMTGSRALATDILLSALAEDPAGALVNSVVRELAVGLATLVCCVNPDGIVLGGSVGVAFAPLLSSLQEQMSRHAYLAVRDTKMRVAELGVDAQLYGAAALCEAVE